MNTNAFGDQKRPTEGDRLGGTLAEGRLATQVNDRLKEGKGSSDATFFGPVVTKAPVKKQVQEKKMDQRDQQPEIAKGLGALHFDHKVWLNSLRFYREELFIFQRHLEQFVTTSAVPESMAHVEQFQNKFIRQSEVIDELGHDIKKHDRTLAGQLSADAPSVVYRPFGIHNELRERMEIFERLYTELKMQFRSWLAYNR